MEYHFTTRAEFERMIAADEFLEWAEVFGNYYGTALSALQDQPSAVGEDLLLDIDVQGAVQVMKQAAGGGVDLYFAAESGGVGAAVAASERGGACGRAKRSLSAG